jgi:hypothetical protein
MHYNDPALEEAAERHADPIDKATAVAEESLRLAIEAAKADVPAPLPATGKCYYCSEPIEAGRRFCDEFCREDHDYMMARRKVNGIKP